MASSKVNLYVDAGVDFTVDIELISDAGTPLLMTTETFSGQARKIYTSNVAFELTFAVYDNGANGSVLEIQLPKEVTTAVEPGKYVYDVIMNMANGNNTKLMEGIIFLLPTATREA